MNEYYELSSPFFLLLDEKANIIEAGQLIQKAVQEKIIDQPFNAIFACKPDIKTIISTLGEKEKTRLIFFQHLRQNQRYKTVIHKTEHNQFLLLTNPVVNTVNKLSDYHLTLSDFSEHDSMCELVFLHQSTGAAISEAIEMNEALERKNLKLRENTQQLFELSEDLKALLGEVHHRVKNNLALISGLLEMKKMNLTDNAFKAGIDEIQHRIRSIALIHESMYKTNSFANINLKDYLQDLTSQIGKFYSSQKKVTIETDIEEILFDNAQALPLALIVNEVITNSYKHAFTEMSEGKILVSLHKSNDLLTLEIRDNGKGLQESDSPKNSLGMKLLGMLSKQLKAKHSIHSDKGLVIQILIPHGE